MSNYETDDDYSDESDEQPENRNLKRLREKADKYDEAVARVAELERGMAVRDAGLTTLNERQLAAVQKMHEGDLTAEALRATAEGLGFVQPPSDPNADADNRMDNARQGAAEPDNRPALEKFIDQTVPLTQAEFWAQAKQYGATTQS